MGLGGVDSNNGIDALRIGDLVSPHPRDATTSQPSRVLEEPREPLLAREEAKLTAGKQLCQKASVEIQQVRKVAVVGAGQMGSGIAEVCSLGGFEVTLVDRQPGRAEAAVATIDKRLHRQVERGTLTSEARSEGMARLETQPECPVASDVVIEAASEDPSLKHALFESLGRRVEPKALLLTNTSSISITRLAAVSGRPTLVAGMHFMNPVPRMQLVEVVKGLQTHPDTLECVLALAKRLGKTTVVSDDRPGFIVNRLLIPMLNEACFALQEQVASIRDIDEGMRLGLNHPMGPLALSDLIGLDTVLAIATVLQSDFGDSKYRACELLRRLVSAGWLGRKAGRGFYEYDEDGTVIGENRALEGMRAE